jgi:hypothetical protein
MWGGYNIAFPSHITSNIHTRKPNALAKYLFDKSMAPIRWKGTTRSGKQYTNPQPFKKATRPRPYTKRNVVPVKSVKRKKVYTGASDSKMSGRLKTPFTIRRRRKENATQRLGTSVTLERGGIIRSGISTPVSGNTVCVGHSTMPQDTIIRLAFRAIFKKFYMKLGTYDMSDWNGTLIDVPGGAIFSLNYYNTEEDTTLSTINCTTGSNVPAPTSFNDLPEFFWKEIIKVSQPQNIRFDALTYFHPNPTNANAPNNTKLVLKDVLLHFYAKSTLKVQNRTLTKGADNESDDVDNVPLYGKSYFGFGNGTGAINKNGNYSIASRDFIGDEKYGTIAKVPNEPWYQEPPGPEVFEKVKQFGKVALSPGDVKTSTLSYRKTISLQQFGRVVFNHETTPDDDRHRRHYLGNYRFMMVEKMINAVGGTEENQISLAFETNLNIGCYATIRKSTFTSNVVDVGNIVAES